MLPERDARAEDRHRLPSQHDDQRGRRRRPGGVAVRGARRSRRTRPRPSGSARRSAAPSATTTSTTRSPRRTTTGCSRSSPTRLRGRTFGDGTRYAEAQLDLATPEQEQARKELQAEIDALKRTEDADAGAARGAGALGAGDPHGRQRAWTPLTVATARGHQRRRRCTPQPDGSVLASGPNPELTTYTVTVETPVARHHRRAARGAARPVAAEGRSGPRRLRALPHHRSPGSRSRAVRPRREPPAVRHRSSHSASRRRSTTPRRRSSRRTCSRRTPAFARGSSGAWTIDAMRETTRLPRQAVLIPETPFGFAAARGSRSASIISTARSARASDVSASPLTTAADPLAGAERAGAAARDRADAARRPRSKADADDLASYFRSTTPSLKPTRDAIAAARKQLTAICRFRRRWS